jgi:alanyl-tRNA synthetase
MNFREIRRCFLEYFRSKGHEIVASSSLIPHDDPTLMFTNAGMVQFKRAFLGEEDRGYRRAASSQKCVRAGGKHNDLENVGYTARHHTFFEMLGNFSFGDYFKEEAIEWAWELLTEGYKLPSDKLYATIFRDDDEAFQIWEKKIGVPAERIVRLGEKDNFWAMGDTGPCGPCSEILIDQGPALGCERPDCAPGCDCDRYLEIWNLVFTQFDRQADGELISLPRPNIDTGMGLERLAAVVQGVQSNYDSDLFEGIIGRIAGLSGKRYGEDTKESIAFRVIADHARAASFLIGDGVMPSNDGRGYVLRRIIRRAIRFGQILGLEDVFLTHICGKVIDEMGTDYEELIRSKSYIEALVRQEEKRFADTLHYSMKILYEEIKKLKARQRNAIPGEVAFKLYDTYGLSVDIVEDVARDENLVVDYEGYEKAMAKQKGLSQESWRGSGEEEVPEVYRVLLARGLKTRFVGYDTLKTQVKVEALIVDGKEADTLVKGDVADIVVDQTPFYAQAGGQAGDVGDLLGTKVRFHVTDTQKYGQELIVHRGRLETGSVSLGQELEAQVDIAKRRAIAINHSATHLLHAALRDVLGDHVKQAGSLVAADRLRFDFSHFTQVTPQQILEVENLVNEHIRSNLSLRTTELSRDEAMKTGAMAIFEERYGERVRLVSMGEGLSMELCGGTHTQRTGDIGLFRIISEGSVAANIRRIEALTGKTALEYDQKQDGELKRLAALMKTTPDKVGERLERLLEEQKMKDRENESMKSKLLAKTSENLLSGIREIRGVKVLSQRLEVGSPKELRDSADRIKDKLGSGIILLGAAKDGKVMLTCIVTKDLVNRFKAGEIVRQLSVIVGGKGGGRADMAQGGGNKPHRLDQALESLFELIEKRNDL